MKILTMVISLGLTVFAGATAQAQNCGYFGNDGCATGFHYVYGTPEMTDSAHSHCLGACAPGSVCHPSCAASFARTPELKRTYEALYEAANRGDVTAVIELATKIPGYVAFNPQRVSVQIRGCGTNVIAANLPVREERLLRLAMRLPTSAQMLAAAAALHQRR